MTTSTRRRRPGTTGRHLYDVRTVHLDDPLVRPLLEDLAREYATRYSDVLSEDDLLREMHEYPAADFAAPHGELVLVLSGGDAVAGGAFRRRSEPELGETRLSLRPEHARLVDGSPAVTTAELKRIWTHAAHRRRGLARIVLGELERRAAARGYERLYLTTGPRQPEAAALYLSTGYTPLFEPDAPAVAAGPLAFEKWLSS